ncbi:MAG: hypothetical protein WBR28_13855 [Mycobacterium sp.]
MKFPEVLDQLPNDPNVRRVYGEPHVTPNGVTVIPVAKIREGRGFAGTPIGVVTGLLAAVIGSLAVLRQPPWPRITLTDYR